MPGSLPARPRRATQAGPMPPSDRTLPASARPAAPARRPGVGDGLGGDRPGLRGRGARPARPHVLRRRPPLRAGRRRGPGAGQQHALRGAPGRRAGLAAAATPPSRRAASAPRAATGCLPDRLRVLPRTRPRPRRTPATASRRTRCTLRRAAGRAARGGVARRAGAARRPGVRRRAHAGTRRWLSLRRGRDAAARTPRSPTSRSTPGSTRESWSDPQVRWLLSTIPSSMIFDDHEMIDDWNTSAAWRADTATDWWTSGSAAACASYWVYQHLGNLEPAGAGREQDLAGRAGLATTDETPSRCCARWPSGPTPSRGAAPGGAIVRHWGDARLIMIDSRAGRVLEEGDRRDARRRGVRLGRGGDAARSRTASST